MDSQLADIILIQKSLLDVFKGQLERIRQEIDNLKQNQELQKHKQEVEFAEEKEREEKRLFGQFQALEAAYEEVRKTKGAKEKEWRERLSNMQKSHSAAFETVEALYEKKLHIEDQKYRVLEQSREESRNKYEQQLVKIEDNNDKEIEKLALGFKEQLKTVQGLFWL